MQQKQRIDQEHDIFYETQKLFPAKDMPESFTVSLARHHISIDVMVFSPKIQTM